MKANPYYLKDTDGGFYNKYPEFEVYEEGKRAGIKEVMEWMKSHMTFMKWQYKDSEGIWDCPIDDIEWQAKLREWGLEA